MSVRLVLIVLNVVAVVALVVIGVLVAVRRRDEARTPANLEKFLPDEDLEGRRLERVLGWSLVCAAVIAVALPVYWLREPTRQDESEDYFDDNAIERGAVLYASPGSEDYDPTRSLQCANCHGSDGGGGAAPAVFTDPETGEVYRASWTAPALNTVLYRFSEEEVTEILNYGRPGSPMQAFGTPGGGPKNAQAISDLVAYLDSIQIPEEEAQQDSADALAGYRDEPAELVASARETLEQVQTEIAELRDDPEAGAADVEDAEERLVRAEEMLEWRLQWQARREGVDDGQLLYELECARCHTKGWSIFDPGVDYVTLPDAPWPPDIVLGAAGGGGLLGFNLRDGAVERRFPADENGLENQAEFLRTGSERNVPYGVGGIGSGRMPGFGGILSDEMIDEIVAYERDGLDEHDPSVPVAVTGTETEEMP